MSPGGSASKQGGRLKRRCGEMSTSDSANSAAVDAQPLRCMSCTRIFDSPRPLRAGSAARQHQRETQHSARCLLCRFKAMDPFNTVVEPVLKCITSCRATVNFSLSLPQLKYWREKGDNVEVRMLQVDCEQVKQIWPLNLKFSANGAQVFTVVPPEEGHKRRDLPQSVTCDLRAGANQISIQMSGEQSLSGYALAILHTTPRSNPELHSQVSYCDEESGRRRVCELLAKPTCDGEDIACLSSDKLRLLCPLSWERVAKPCRGKRCQHLQCFDLEAFLRSNRRMQAFNKRWVCPLCSLVLRPPDLVFDSYVHSVLKATTADIEEAVVRPDGSWTATPPDAPKNLESEQLPVAQKRCVESGESMPALEEVSTDEPQGRQVVDIVDSDVE
eukprot:gnl/TRDRNA2_/TRDRNA2_86141_c0_seq2.p1 gnl/TRDRNA2_/TRDRNA2_86141_c0~~gnl/TRDRNA2_/TRDRNA2_86141_c0_seq2.p1  ORF type:complete len:398 (-),score=51.72 gnl/TRDRNA2_/TRDRNA2_86141_c0_seq2:17-1177(-)